MFYPRVFFFFLILTVQHVNHHVRRRDFARDARVIAAVVELGARDQQLAGGPVLTFLRFQRDATPVEGKEVTKLLERC